MTTNTETIGLFARIGRVRTGRFIVGLITLLVSTGYTWQAFLIPFGTIAQPGAGVFPRVVGVAAIGISILVIIEALVSERDPQDEIEFELPHGKHLRQILVFFGSTALYAVLLPFLGQYITATLYTYVVLMYFGKRAALNWFKSGVYAIIAGVAVPYLFIKFLLVDLPDGMILPALFPSLF